MDSPIVTFSRRLTELETVVNSFNKFRFVSKPPTSQEVGIAVHGLCGILEEYRDYHFEQRASLHACYAHATTMQLFIKLIKSKHKGEVLPIVSFSSLG